MFALIHRARCLARQPALAARAAVAVAMVLLFLPPEAGAQPATNVLILRGGSPEHVGGRVIIDTIESTVRKEFPAPVEFYIENIDTSRYVGEGYDQRMADLFAETYKNIRVDLVVAFAGPAVDFALRHRARLFPATPLLLGFVEPRALQGRSIPDGTGVVFVQLDTAGTVRLALATYPAARRVLVIGGVSPFDRGWQALVRQDLRDLGSRVSVEYDTDGPLPDVLRRVASLPGDTAVLYISMLRDGGGVPTSPTDVLERLRAVSPVPIYGLSTTHLGSGIVGGALIDFDRHGSDLGREAVRALSGERPRTITTPATIAVDWREMQRFGIPASSLPPLTRVAFRDPGLWARYKGTILVVSFVLGAQAALIVALVQVGRRRREAQRLLESRLQFEQLLSELTLSLATIAPGRIDAALDEAIARIAAAIGIDWAWRWEFDAAGDGGWDSPTLRAGQPAIFDDPVALPPAIQRALRAAGARACSSVAVPLAAGGRWSGAIFWVSRGAVSSWRVGPDDLRMIVPVVGTLLERKHTEGVVEESDRLKGAILNSLPAHVAVLDREGTIIAVNAAWMESGGLSGAWSEAAAGVGDSYLAACIEGARAGREGASEARAAVEAACAGGRIGPPIEYRRSVRDGQRWFVMTIEPLRRPESGAVVTHVDITERKRNEIALVESEGRFRALADALPVGVWMSDAQAQCVYFNEQWLRMTGRSLEEEVGHGWISGVHPEDKAACMDGYLRAFRTRQRFSMDYRIRQRDGEYRWFMDVGIPRYGSDGVFRGYVGGAVDITDRRRAELVLRDLNRRLLVAQEDERRRIARELHDHLSQQLAVLAIDLQQLGASPPASREALVVALQDSWRRTADIASDVHAISHQLHPSKLEALGLAATVRAHCRDVSRQSVDVHFSERGVPKEAPHDVALCMFRVTQEALSNVARHSGAREAHVSLAGVGQDLVLRVSDRGRGFEETDRIWNGLGLTSMRERLQALGGTLTIDSTPGKGTVVEARVSCVRTADQELDRALA